MAGRSIVPKGCFPHRIELHAGAGHKLAWAEVGYRCGDEGGGKSFPSASGGTSTYRSKAIPGVRTVEHRGMNVGAPARIGFTLAPAHAYCWVERRGVPAPTIRCTMKGDLRSPYLAGTSGRKRRGGKR